jgi:hypothetical protein
MIIILEGPSKCGKTTLANYIREKYGFNVFKFSQPKGDAYTEYVNAIKMVNREGGDWVFDRFHIGEQVFGPIYRGKSSMNSAQIKEIEIDLLELNTCIIYCFDDEKNIKKRFKECKEEFEKTKHITKILELFEKEINNSCLPVHFHKIKSKMDMLLNNKIDMIIEYKYEIWNKNSSK